MYVAMNPTNRQHRPGNVPTRRTYFQRGHKLRQCNKQEVEVEEEFKLFVKYNWEEGERIVLLVLYDIWGVFIAQFVCAASISM